MYNIDFFCPYQHIINTRLSISTLMSIKPHEGPNLAPRIDHFKLMSTWMGLIRFRQAQTMLMFET